MEIKSDENIPTKKTAIKIMFGKIRAFVELGVKAKKI